MSFAKLLLWMAGSLVLLRGIAYIMAARIYLTCALRKVGVAAIGIEELPEQEGCVLNLEHERLIAAGFRHLGFLRWTPLLSYYVAPHYGSVYVNEAGDIHAVVQPLIVPEYGKSLVVWLTTQLASGLELLTTQASIIDLLDSETRKTEQLPDATLEEMLRHHTGRIEAQRSFHPACAMSLDEMAAAQEKRFSQARERFRTRGWTIPTTDPVLDRFTLRGAFALVNHSRKALKGAPRTSTPIDAGPQVRRDRLLAETNATLRIAAHPESAPGTPWALLSVVFATAVLSLVAMSILWNFEVAAAIFIVIAVHEAGHALAMRASGYRSVHVFFVPLLGALTVGRPSDRTAPRHHMGVLLAGPLPGLCIAVALLALDAEMTTHVRWLFVLGISFLLVNALNLLPLTPFDGGRLLESLTRPTSIWRLAVQVISAVALLGFGLYLREPLFVLLGILSSATFPRQIRIHRLRRAIQSKASASADFPTIVRLALDEMTHDAYRAMKSATRQMLARALAEEFTKPLLTAADRRFGLLAYAAAWIPVAIAVRLWLHP